MRSKIEKLRARLNETNDLMMAHSKLFREAMEKATSYARRAEACEKIALRFMSKKSFDSAVRKILNQNDRSANP